MFDFIFGLVWTIFTSIFILGFYFSGGNITVNGIPVTQEEFNAMLWPKILFGVFLLIGLTFLIRGIKHMLTNTTTTLIGREAYGYILTSYPNGTIVNGRPLHDAEILVAKTDNTFEIFTENIGGKLSKYYPGSYVKVKYHNKDVNILNSVHDSQVPYATRNRLQNELENEEKYAHYNISGDESKMSDTIIVDGVEYVRKNPLDI